MTITFQFPRPFSSTSGGNFSILSHGFYATNKISYERERENCLITFLIIKMVLVMEYAGMIQSIMGFLL